MNLKIHALGGYEEVGRNMTCVETENEAVILDMGVYMDRFVPLQDERQQWSTKTLIKEDVIPDDRPIHHLKKKMKAIVLSHAHLDHIGAAFWLSSFYDCPILTTPYTNRILQQKEENDGIKLKNKLICISPNSSYKISNAIEIEFILATHSVIHSSMINIITPKGNILYSLDYKFDNHPVIGQTTNKQRLRQLGKEHTLALIVDSTNAEKESKTYSESVAKEMLRDVMLGMESEKQAMFVSTFSSHIARLKTIMDVSKNLDREVVFLGRSLSEYINAAEELDFVNFSENAEIIKSPYQSKKRLNEINKNKENYIIVATGSQGEANATLSKIVNDDIPLQLDPNDFVIFACGVIPTPTIQANRRILEHKIHHKKGRIFKDIHVSGHASREDIRDLIKIVSPENIIPGHGDMRKLASVATLSTDMGYSLGKNVHLLQNGQHVNL
ncbi:MAG: RNase J family beta-CASP ribonuclease [Candidatus Thermoplasmatota archaeon]|nr:RNase J family beta-CASP ribonuclease [Candidatus Thermoplasmatota archaeon]